MRTRFAIIVSTVVVGLVTASAGFAHHGSAAFEEGKVIVLKGTVKEWVYSNPHCLLLLDVKGEDGTVKQWVAEGQAPNTIFPVGYRKDTFKVGEQVTVTVQPAKNSQAMGRILETVLANGTVLGPASSTGAPQIRTVP